MRLYHVSYEPVHSFELRVPANRLDEEDGSIPRICFGTTIENCINAKPEKANGLFGMLQFSERVNAVIFVYSFDTSQVHPDCIVYPEKLEQKHGVLDASITKEHWVLCIPELAFKIYRIEDAIFETCPMSGSKTVTKIYVETIIGEPPENSSHLIAKQLNQILGTDYRTDVIFKTIAEGIEERE